MPRTAVIPGHSRRCNKFWVEEYYPKTRQSLAATDLPNGKELYAYRVKIMTTTDMTPDEIHGSASPRSTHPRGDGALKAQTGFTGTLRGVLHASCAATRSSSTGRASDCSRLPRHLQAHRPELMQLFGKLPRMPYGVIPSPQIRRPTPPPRTTTAGRRRPTAPAPTS